MNDEPIFVGREKELEDFVSMLEREIGHWVFALTGAGGIGKTRLLEEMIVLSRDHGAIHSELIDFYYTDLHTETGLLSDIGQRLGFEHFPQLVQSLVRCGTGPAAVREEMLNLAVEHFISGLRDLASGHPVVLFFDTFEKATETGVAGWFLEEVLPQMRGSAVAVLAGRNAFRLAEGDYEVKGAPGYRDAVIPLPPEEVRLLSLATFSFSEVHEYLKQDLAKRDEGDVPLQVDAGRYADLDRPPAEVQTIWEKSEGHPVVVALAADWLAEWGAGSITDIADLPPEQFKRAMVSKVLDLSTPEDQAILRMAHVYHRFDAEILDACYPELREEGFDPGQVIRDLSRFSFRKYWPETGTCLLHDEMQRLVEHYVWGEIDLAKDVRRKISADVVEYYDRALAREPDERVRWVLEAERMYHRLYSDLEKERSKFWWATYDAWTQYKLDAVKMLLSMGEEVNGKLKDPLLDITCRVVRAWVQLAEGNPEEARKMAQSVLDDPASTQRTRAAALSALGVYVDRKGDVDLAIERYREALRFYRDLEARLVEGEAPPAEHGIPRLSELRAEIATLLNRIGIAHRRKGLLERAVAYYDQARAVARQDGNLELLADALNNRGRSCLAQCKG
jgi:tetratricopeptide (TPR) repeat protein